MPRVLHQGHREESKSEVLRPYWSESNDLERQEANIRGSYGNPKVKSSHGGSWSSEIREKVKVPLRLGS